MGGAGAWEVGSDLHTAISAGASRAAEGPCYPASHPVGPDTAGRLVCGVQTPQSPLPPHALTEEAWYEPMRAL